LRLAALGVDVRGLCNGEELSVERERDREANKSLTATSSLKEIIVEEGQCTADVVFWSFFGGENLHGYKRRR
jgi:hypothetical protein